MTLFECRGRCLAAVVRLYLLYCRKERLLAFDLGTLDSDHRGSPMVFVWCRLKRNESEIDTVFNYQWKGSVKVREIRKDLKNTYRRPKAKPFHAQVELYNYYKNKANQD